MSSIFSKRMVRVGAAAAITAAASSIVAVGSGQASAVGTSAASPPTMTVTPHEVQPGQDATVSGTGCFAIPGQPGTPNVVLQLSGSAVPPGGLPPVDLTPGADGNWTYVLHGSNSSGTLQGQMLTFAARCNGLPSPSAGTFDYSPVSITFIPKIDPTSTPIPSPTLTPTLTPTPTVGPPPTPCPVPPIHSDSVLQGTMRFEASNTVVGLTGAVAEDSSPNGCSTNRSFSLNPTAKSALLFGFIPVVTSMRFVISNFGVGYSGISNGYVPPTHLHSDLGVGVPAVLLFGFFPIAGGATCQTVQSTIIDLAAPSTTTPPSTLTGSASISAFNNCGPFGSVVNSLFNGKADITLVATSATPPTPTPGTPVPSILPPTMTPLPSSSP